MPYIDMLQYDSRSGTPFEIVVVTTFEPVTTQRYLGKISDTEALKWIENLYG